MGMTTALASGTKTRLARWVRPQHQDAQQQRGQVGREPGGVAQDHQDVGGHDDARGGDHEAQLGAPSGLDPAARSLVVGERRVRTGTAASLPAAAPAGGGPARAPRALRVPATGARYDEATMTRPAPIQPTPGARP